MALYTHALSLVFPQQDYWLWICDLWFLGKKFLLKKIRWNVCSTIWRNVCSKIRWNVCSKIRWNVCFFYCFRTPVQLSNLSPWCQESYKWPSPSLHPCSHLSFLPLHLQSMWTKWIVMWIGDVFTAVVVKWTITVNVNYWAVPNCQCDLWKTICHCKLIGVSNFRWKVFGMSLSVNVN